MASLSVLKHLVLCVRHAPSSLFTGVLAHSKTACECVCSQVGLKMLSKLEILIPLSHTEASACAHSPDLFPLSLCQAE